MDTSKKFGTYGTFKMFSVMVLKNLMARFPNPQTLSMNELITSIENGTPNKLAPSADAVIREDEAMYNETLCRLVEFGYIQKFITIKGPVKTPSYALTEKGLALFSLDLATELKSELTTEQETIFDSIG